jgi:MFS family permease
MVITAGYGMNGVVGPLLAELYPTYLRATGPGIVQNLGKGIGGSLGPILVGALVPVLGFPLTIAAPGLIFAAVALGIYALPAVDRREVHALEHEEYLGLGQEPAGAGTIRSAADPKSRAHLRDPEEG